jgi:ubiquinone/menaquinone biosynthesis C-methylase UbiE
MSAVAENVQSAQYVDFWNEILVPKFIKYKHILVDGLTHHSEAIFPSLPVKEGDRVLDVGCGFGDTAIKLAQRVGPKGKVVGLDCCDAFLEYGRKDAARLGLQNISFVNGDALLDRFEPEYDFVFSRFGTMFFANPVAGLRNMRTALKPGGIMTHTTTIRGSAWPRTWCCSFCRRPARTRSPAGRGRSRWRTSRWSGR